MTEATTKGVRTLHPDYVRMLPKWKRCRDAVAGQDAIHAAGEEYLDKFTGEGEAEYRARVRRSDFFNGTWITIRGFSGMMSRKDATVDVPAKIKPYLGDITLAGCSAEDLAKRLSHEALTVSRYGLLVDHMPEPEPAPGKKFVSQYDSEKLGLRPCGQLYRAETITNWRKAVVNGRRQYVMVTLTEQHAVEDTDEFSQETETRYRVLDLDGGKYRQRVFRINDKGEDELVSTLYPTMGREPIGYIPFRTYGPEGEDDEIDDPTMIDLVNANIAVYQLNSNYRHTMLFCPPVFFVTGHALEAGETISIGGTSALILPNPDATVSYAEPQGSMVPELRAGIAEKKQEMAMAGARAIADETRQAETLGGTQIKRTGENSALANIALSISASMEWMLGEMATWAGAEGKVVFQLNREFLAVAMDPQMLVAQIGAWQAGAISEADLFANLQRGDVIDSTKTLAVHQAEIDAAPPPMPSPPAANDGEDAGKAA